MDFSAITVLTGGFDPTALIPELDTFLGQMEGLVRLLVLIGPLLMLGFGLLYLFAPTKEANHKLGFRALFGMGSVRAWQYTQRLAGMCFTGLGGVLTIVMLIVSFGFDSENSMKMVSSAVTCLIWEAALAAVCFVAINVVVAIFFDWQGNLRKK